MNHFHKAKKSLLAAAAALLLLTGCGKTPEKAQAPAPAEPAATEQVLQTKEGLQTILVLCLDAYDEAVEAGGFRNPSRADFAMLMVIDEQAGKITSLQINPDTVVPFKVPGKSETVEMPLGQLYSYGSGGSDSALYVTKAVSGLLKGVKVDHYLTFTMDAVGIVNDMIGGVAVPVQPGSEETRMLSGKEAAAFFSSRDAGDLSNEKHMENQRQYMGAMYGPFMASTQNEDFLTKLSLQLGERMGTGLTLSQLIEMFETMSAYAMEEEILTLPGTAREEAGQICFTVEEDAVSRMVETLFLAQ